MKKLYRDRWDKKIAGVCGGFGRFFGIDPTVLRLLGAVLCLFTAILPLVTIYLIAWLLIPLGPTTYVQFKCRRLYRSRKNRKIAGVCGGIAEMLKVNAMIIRFVAFIAMMITGILPLVITYFLGALIIPACPKSIYPN
ncbi:MAG: PspC domain-containing protein [Chlamydiota bacterium]